MTQIILQVDDSTILPALEQTLKLLKGVKVTSITDMPAAKTVSAIKQAKEGKVTRCKSSNDMFISLRK